MQSHANTKKYKVGLSLFSSENMSGNYDCEKDENYSVDFSKCELPERVPLHTRYFSDVISPVRTIDYTNVSPDAIMKLVELNKKSAPKV